MIGNAMRLFVICMLIAMGISFGNLAHAQKKGSDGVIRLEETVIEGRVQKPNAFFINTRQGMVYEVMELRESFISEIAKVVDDGDF